MQPWWTPLEFCSSLKTQVKEFLSLGWFGTRQTCHCDDSQSSSSLVPSLYCTETQEETAMTMNRADKAAGHWAEGVPGWTANATSAFLKILLTETRTAAKKHQIPTAGSTSKTPKRNFFSAARKVLIERGEVVLGCEWLVSPPWCEQPGVDPCYRATGLTGLPPASSGYSWHFTPLPLSLPLSRELHPAADKPQCFCFSMSWIPHPSIARGLLHGGLEVSVNAMCESTAFSGKGWPQLTYWHCSSDLTQFVKLGQNTISRDWRISSWLPLFSCIRYSL